MTELAALAPLANPSINTAWLTAMSSERWIELATAIQHLLIL